MAAGATVAALVLQADPPNLTYALLAVVVLAAAGATAGSRWYITSGFTTFFVFLMLLNGGTDDTTAKFNERMGETILGVTLAYLFGWTLPWLLDRGASSQPLGEGVLWVARPPVAHLGPPPASPLSPRRTLQPASRSAVRS